VIQLI